MDDCSPEECPHADEIYKLMSIRAADYRLFTDAFQQGFHGSSSCITGIVSRAHLYQRH